MKFCTLVSLASADVHIEIWTHRDKYFREKLHFPMKIRWFWELYFVNTKTQNLYIVHRWNFAHFFLTHLQMCILQVGLLGVNILGKNFIFPWKFAAFENRTLWTLKLTTYTLYTADFLHTCFSPYTDEHIAIWFHFRENFIVQWKFRFCEHYNFKSINFT